MSATLYEQYSDALLTRGHRCIPWGDRAAQIASALSSARALALRLPENPKGREWPLGHLVTVCKPRAASVVHEVSGYSFSATEDFGPVCDIEVNISLRNFPAAQEIFPELQELQPIVDANFELLAGTFEEMNRDFGLVGRSRDRKSMVRIHHNPVIVKDDLPHEIIQAIADLRLGSVRQCLGHRLHGHSDESYASSNDQDQLGVQHETADGTFHDFPVAHTSIFHGHDFADQAGKPRKMHRVSAPQLMIGRAREPMPPGRTSLTCLYNPFS